MPNKSTIPMKTRSSIITLCFLICLSPFFLAGQTIKIDTVSACPGDTILVPVTATDLVNMAAISLAIGYNPNVATYLAMTNVNPLIAGAMANAVSVPAHEIRVGWFTMGSAGVNIPSGKLFDLRMIYMGGAANLIIDPSSELSDNNYNLIPATLIPGRVQPAPIPSITQQPQHAYACPGSTKVISLMATNATTFGWEILNNGTWTPLINAGNYSGVNTSDLNITTILPSMHLNQYRCRIDNVCHIYSDIVTLFVSNPSANAGPDDTICFGGTTYLTASVSGGFAPFSYLWTPGGTNASIAVTPGSSQLYQLQITDSLGCLTSDQMVVVVSNPTTTANGDDTICLGASKTILANTDDGIAPYSFSWQHGGNQWQTTVSPTQPTTYTVVSTDAFGCVSMGSATIDVSAPAVYAGDNDTICTGSSSTLFAGNSGGYGPFQYQWSNQATTQQIVVSPTQNTGYNVTVTDRFNCTATSQTQVVVSNPATTVGPDDTLCLGQQKTITALTTGGYTPYLHTWNTTQTTPNITVVPGATSPYSVTVTDRFGCVSGDNITIYVSNPLIDAGPHDTICFGSQATIQTNTSGGFLPYQFLWSNNSTTGNIQVSPTSTTWYKVTVTDLAGCSANDSMLVAVSHPTVVVGNNDTICINTTATLTAVPSGGFGTLQYLWSTSATQNAIMVTPITSTTYSVTLTDHYNCQATASKAVIVSNPVANAGADQGACIGTPVTFNGQVTGGFAPYSYSWNGSPGQQFQTTSSSTALLTFLVTDKFNCVSTDQATLTAWPNPVITPIPNDTACYNTAAPLTAVATGGTGTLSYLWSTNATTASIAPVITQNSTFWVRATDVNNCKASDTVLVLVSNPAVNLGNNDTLCKGAVKAISAAPAGGFAPYSYAWTTGGSGSSINVTTNTDTCVTVTVTDKMGCVTNDNLCVVVSKIAANAGADQGACVGTQVTFNGSAINGFAPYTYTWNNNPGQSYQILSTANTTLIFKATDKFNCQSTDTALLTAWQNPVLTPIPDDTACYNTAAPLTASATGGTGTLSYLWSTNATTASIAPVITQNSTFWVRTTDINNCKASDTVLVLVSNPAVNLGNNDTLCKGAIKAISAAPAGGFAPYSYAWTTGGSGSSINVTTNTDTCVTVTVTDKVGCVANDNLCVVVSKIAANAGADQGACVGTQVTFNGSATNGFAPYTYTWNNNPGQSYQILSTANTTLVFKATDKFNCQSTDTALLTAWQNPILTPIPDDTACFNTVSTLTASATGGTGTITYLWSTSATTQSISPVITQNSTFWVKATDIHSCAVSDTVTVFVSNPTINLGPDLAKCYGDVAIVTGVPAGGYMPYHFAWSTGTSGITAVQISVMSDTCVSVVVTDLVGCEALDTVCIMVNTLPLPNLGPDDTICINHVTTLDPGAGFVSYLWSTGASSPTLPLNGATLGTGTFQFSVTVTNQNACSNADTIVIVVDPCIGIYTPQSNYDLSIRPNPASRYIDITFGYPGHYTLQITNSAGNTVLQERIDGDPAAQQRIWINHLTPGFYLVHLRTPEGTFTRKLVVQ
jgi:hypothetical protein